MKSTYSSERLRWDPYFMKSGSGFDAFWNGYLSNRKRNMLYVLGRGFDPRMCSGFSRILDAGGDGNRDCVLIKFDEGPDSPSIIHSKLVEANLQKLTDLVDGRGQIEAKDVAMWSGEGSGRHRIGSLSAAKVFSDSSAFTTYTDVVIDISAMPRGVYYPLIRKVAYLLEQAKERDQNRVPPNLHVVVCENAKQDGEIRDVGIDDSANYVHGFLGDLGAEASEEIPKVWLPILGEDQKVQLQRIYSLLQNPAEICPVLPSPSLDPRRGDRLLVEYRELLFDQWVVEPKNIIYASEQNPFEAYRQLCGAVEHYRIALEPLGGCKAVISCVSSKLLSLGALLAAWETGAALAHVEAHGYELSVVQPDKSDHSELFTLWLSGECYE